MFVRLTTSLFLVLPAIAMAQEATKRPVLSDVYVASDPLDAVAQAMLRSKLAEDEQLARFQAHDGGIDTFVRNDPILQRVSWPYETCTDLTSLLPSPIDGWGLRSETLSNQAPNISDSFLQISFVTFDPSPDLRGNDVFATEQSVTITINADPGASAAFGIGFTDPALRDMLLTEGPYGYPILPYGGHSTLLGPYLVDVSGTGTENAALYFDRMVRCAIESGLIAEGLDPAMFNDIQ